MAMRHSSRRPCSWDYAGAFAATGLGLVVWAGGAVVLGRRAGLRAGRPAATIS